MDVSVQLVVVNQPFHPEYSTNANIYEEHPSTVS